MTPGAALLVALLSQNPTSAAGAGPEVAATSVSLDVRAAPGCTSRSDLTVRIAARSPRIQVVDDAPVSARVDVTSPRPGSVVADLFLASAGAEQPPRRVVARSCAEVADGVALIIAVTLDPNLRRQPAAGVAANRGSADQGKANSRAGRDTSAASASATPGAGPVPRPPASSEELPAATTTQAAPPARASSVAQPPPPVSLTSVAPPVRRPATTTRRELGVSLAGQTIFGPAPAVMPGIAIYVMAALDRDGAWAPALFVGATHVGRAGLSESGGTASFALDAATLDACPLRLRWSRLTARPCASALVGRLSSKGSDTDQQASATRPFGVAGAAMTASFGSTVELSARLGVGLTVLRDSYEFGNAVFHQSSLFTISASVGIGVHWP